MNISEKDYKKIKNLYDLKNVNEIEVRFGKFTSSNFNPTITVDDFIRLNEYLRSFCVLSNIEYSIIKIIKDMRKIDIMSDPMIDQFPSYTECKILKTIVMKKTKLLNIDIKEYNIRFASSFEEKLEYFPENNEDILKFRKRFIYNYNDFHFHLSMIKIDQTIKYEIEIEIQHVKKFEEFFKFLTTEFMYAFQHTNKVITNKTRNDIIKDYSQLTNTKKFIGIQPESLRYEKINFNEKYAVSDKFDGERKLLYFRKSRIIVWSKSKTLWILNKDKIKEDFCGTILDCEYQDGKFHIFDILFFKNTNVQDSHLKERITLYENVVNELKIPQLKIKNYYFGNLYNTVTERLEQQDPLKTDGVILTPFHKVSSVPFKFKNDRPNTIDFKIKDTGFTSDNRFKIWELYCYDENKNDILFTIPEYSLNGKCLVPIHLAKMYTNNSVIEFYYDKKMNIFVPMKCRFDKETGNFIGVAKDNFYLDMYPFNVCFLKHKDLTIDKLYTFNFERYINFTKRHILNTLNSRGNLLWVSENTDDIYKFIDNNIRNINVYNENKDYSEFKIKYDNIKENETTKNFVFDFIEDQFLYIQNKFSMIVCFDMNFNYSCINIQKISELLETCGKIIICISDITDIVLPFKSPMIDIFIDRNDLIITVHKKEKKYKINNIKTITKWFEEKGMKLVYKKKATEFYNDWEKNNNFMSMSEKYIAETIVYIMFEKI